MNADLLQRLASFASLFVAIVLIKVASNVRYWCSYGRETGMVAGSSLLAVALVRIGRTELDLYDVQEASVMNAYLLIAHGAILCGVVSLHLARHYYLGKAKKA